MNIKKKVVLGNNIHSKTNKPFTGELLTQLPPPPPRFPPLPPLSLFFAHLPSSSFPLRTVFVDCMYVCVLVCMHGSVCAVVLYVEVRGQLLEWRTCPSAMAQTPVSDLVPLPAEQSHRPLSSAGCSLAR